MKRVISVLLVVALASAQQVKINPETGLLDLVGSSTSGSGTLTNVATGCGLSGGPITTTGTIIASQTVNAQTGTTYTVLTGDCGKLVTHTNGSAIAVTLPQAGVSFPSGWFFDVQNRGAGTATITPTTSTIDGAASLALTTGQGVRIFSDGTNYFTQRGMGSSSSSGAPVFVCADSGGDDTYTPTCDRTVSAYAEGQVFYFTPTTTVSGGTTADFGPGAVAIKITDGTTNPAPVMMPANTQVLLRYKASVPAFILNEAYYAEIPSMTGNAYAKLSNDGSLPAWTWKDITPCSGVQSITAAGNTISADRGYVCISATSALTLTSNPTIADGVDGECIVIVNAGATNSLILRDEAVATSNLNFGGSNYTLAAGRQTPRGCFNATTGLWVFNVGSAASGTDRTLLTWAATTATVAAAVTSYWQATGSNAHSTTERGSTIGESGTLSHLYIRTTTSQTVNGAMTCVVRVNSADTALTLTMAAGSGPTTYSDLVNTVAVTAGDRIGIACANAAPATASASITASSITLTF